MRKVRGHHGKVPEVNFLHALLTLSPGSKAILELVPFGRKTVSHEASFQFFLQQGAGQENHEEGDGCVPGSEHACTPTAAHPIERDKRGILLVIVTHQPCAPCRPLTLLVFSGRVPELRKSMGNFHRKLCRNVFTLP